MTAVRYYSDASGGGGGVVLSTFDVTATAYKRRDRGPVVHIPCRSNRDRNK